MEGSACFEVTHRQNHSSEFPPNPAAISAATIGPEYATTLTRHVFESFVQHAAIALHVTVQGGRSSPAFRPALVEPG